MEACARSPDPAPFFLCPPKDPRRKRSLNQSPENSRLAPPTASVKPPSVFPATFGLSRPEPLKWNLIGRSSNGKTADSGSAYRGSSPCLPAKLFQAEYPMKVVSVFLF